MNNKRGFILLLTFALMVALTLMVGGLMYMATVSTRDIGAVTADYQLLNLADAGIQRAYREIRNEVLTPPRSGVADLRGATTSGTATNVANVRYVDGSYATVASNTAILNGFDSNYAGANITAISIVAVAGRQTQGSGATMQVSYSVSGGTGATKLTVALPNSANLVEYTQDITGDRAWAWSDILGAASNFTLTATRTAGNRNIYLDALYLRVTYRINTLLDLWSTGGYATFPITLGSGKIQSVSIMDEQGKVHLNTASQTLLSYLMQELGIAAASANTLATNIVTYRTTKPFDSVEELQQVTGMTSANYNLIKDYVTVYSFINTYVQRTTGARAPININTAPLQVLKAVFDPLGLGTGDPASLANDIISTRTVTPFTCFYSANAAVSTDFYDFVRARSYLTAAEQNIVLDNADASLLVPVSGATASNSVTTEFVYNTNVFKINSLANMLGRNFRAKIIMGADGSRTFTTYSGDTSPVGYRKENFE